MKNKIIAIDFDGTITDDTPYPVCGNLRTEAVIYIHKLYKLGYKLVLWTARKDKYYDECIYKLKEWNLYKYFSFDNLTNTNGKIYADFYIDDRSLMEKIDWKKIYNYIINNI